jgi:hypothetical protein
MTHFWGEEPPRTPENNRAALWLCIVMVLLGALTRLL